MADLRRDLDRHRAVLEVDPKHIVSGGAGNSGDLGRTGMTNAERKHDLAAREPSEQLGAARGWIRLAGGAHSAIN
jgi:hypothetical protein